MKSLLHSNDCFLQVECWPENAPAFIAAMKAERYHLVHRIDDDYYFAKSAQIANAQTDSGLVEYHAQVIRTAQEIAALVRS
jgi:hypothetical protein